MLSVSTIRQSHDPDIHRSVQRTESVGKEIVHFLGGKVRQLVEQGAPLGRGVRSPCLDELG